MDNSLHNVKTIERLALNTPNLKDYGKKGTNLRNEPKEGFIRLRDNRVIKLSDVIKDKSNPQSNALDHELIEAQAANFPDLFNCKNIAYKDGALKSGYYVLESEKVISLKKLNEAVTEAAKDINVSSAETPAEQKQPEKVD